jgi:hypothetical protein
MSLAECKKIAVSGLKKCYGPRGIYAGLHQYRDYWSRDSMWACMGALELNDVQIVRKNLELFLNLEKNGLVPLRIGNRFFIQTFLGIKSKKEYPKYREYQNESVSTDANTLFVIAVYKYYEKTKDKKFLKKYYKKIEQILMRTYRFKDEYGLIEEDAYATWMDGLRKKGKIFYSNVLFYVAVKYYLEICRKTGLKSNSFSEKFLKNMENNIRTTFWNGMYFTDWLGNNDEKYFDTFANLVAVYFDFATGKEKASIFKFIESKKLVNESGLILKSFPEYSSIYISPFLILMGLKGYCSKVTYPWMSFFYFLCLKKENKLFEKNRLRLENLCKIVIKDGVVYETYNFKLKPYKTLLYTSERPFAWACSFAVLLLKEN